MPLDRPSVKARARQLIRTSNPSVLTASLIMTALGVLITLLSNRLTGVSADVAKRYLEYYESGNLDAAFNVILTNTPSSGAQFIGLLLNCVSIILALGFTIFLLNTLRRTGPVLGNLLDGFAYWWKLLVLDFVCAIFIFLWSLLLVIPGFIAAYRYSMVRYILINNPDIGINRRAQGRALRAGSELSRMVAAGAGAGARLAADDLGQSLPAAEQAAVL